MLYAPLNDGAPLIVSVPLVTRLDPRVIVVDPEIVILQVFDALLNFIVAGDWSVMVPVPIKEPEVHVRVPL